MTVLDQAQNFSGGVIAAARQRDRWARREANATDDEQREQYREAIADLQARYPDLEEVEIGGAEAFARERGHGSGSRSPVHDGRRRQRAAGRPSPATRSKTAPAAPKRPPRKPVPGLDPTARRQRSSSRPVQRQARPQPTPRVDRAIRQTGVPAAAASGGSALMSLLGVTVGLAFTFLILSSSERPGTGAAAVPAVVNAVTRALGRFISTEDVFSSTPVAAAGAAAGSGPSYPEGAGSNVRIAANRLRKAELAEQRRKRRPASPAQGRIHR